MQFVCKQKKLSKSKATKKKLSLNDCIDLTGKSSVARKTHEGMTASNKRDAADKIATTLQTKINREVKSTLLDVAHRGNGALLCGIPVPG